MAFDGIITSAIANELRELLTGGKIEKIYQPQSDELIFHIHSRQGNFKLCASCASNCARVHLLGESPANPPSPPAFCMLLRKHLSGGRVTEIAQAGAERVLQISVDTISELGFSVSKILIIEIMGKHSNIILIDGTTRKIIDSAKRISIDASRLRQILPGKEYELPPSQGKTPPDQMTPESIQLLCTGSPETISKSLLGAIQGISPGIASYLSHILEIPAEDSANYGSIIFLQLRTMLEKLDSGDFTPIVYMDEEGSPLDFHVFPLPEFEGFYEKRLFDSANACVEFYFAHKAGTGRTKQQASDLKKAVKNRLDKLYLKKQRLSEDLLNAENSEQYRLYGELLTANLHLVKPGAEKARIISYYDGAEVIIPLDRRLSPSKNAQSYFKKYGKAKTALKEKAIQLADTNSEVAYLETVDTFVENVGSTEEVEMIRSELIGQGYLRKRKTQAKPSKTKPAPYAYVLSGGFRVLAGRNNQENDHLTFQAAARTDIWFHTKDIPGSHVILFTEGRTPDEATIHQTAAIAAYHSKGKASENVPVDYVLVKHVKKPSGAKPGMVIFTNNRTVYVHPSIPREPD